jgi:hypothetical protein
VPTSWPCLHACKSAAARLPDLRKRVSEIGMLDVAESVDVGVEVDADVDAGVGVDLDGDVEIQHNTAQHSILQHDHLSAFSNPRHIRVNRWTIWSRGIRLGWAGDVAMHIFMSIRLPGDTSISRVTSHTGGRLFGLCRYFRHGYPCL